MIPASQRPRVVLRYGDGKDLLVSGLLEYGKEIAQHPAVVDVPIEGTHRPLLQQPRLARPDPRNFLVFNAILNFDHLTPAGSSRMSARP